MTKEINSGGKSIIDMFNELIAMKLPNDLEQKLKSNLSEVRARGGELYVFADAD